MVTKKCKLHPRYQAKRRPRARCNACWNMYLAKLPLAKKSCRRRILLDPKYKGPQNVRCDIKGCNHVFGYWVEM